MAKRQPKTAYEQLADKQRTWLEEYIQNGFNATGASRKMGYKGAEQHGLRMSQNVGILSALKERLEEMKLGSDKVMAMLSEVARSDIKDVLDISENGVAMPDLSVALKNGKTNMIKKYKVGKNGVEIEVHDRVAALMKLADLHAKIAGAIDDDDMTASLDVHVTIHEPRRRDE